MTRGAFISYSYADRDFVHRLAEGLRRNDIPVWFDEDELAPGDSIIGAIGAGIDRTDFLIVVLSPAAVASGWVAEELRMALHKGISGRKVTVIPVLREDCEIPGFLRDRKYVDMRPAADYAAGLEKLVRRLRRDLELAAALPGFMKDLEAHEAGLRRRIREGFCEDVPYYVPLAGETTEPADRDAACAPDRSARRRRMRPEYRAWIGEGREMRRVKLATLREGVDKYPCIILLGEPGCGKTAALRHLAYRLAGEPGRLPLPLALSGFGPHTALEDFILRGLSDTLDPGKWHWGMPQLAAHLDSLLESGRLFLLLDALNEMPHRGYRRRVEELRRFIDRLPPPPPTGWKETTVLAAVSDPQVALQVRIAAGEVLAWRPAHRGGGPGMGGNGRKRKIGRSPAIGRTRRGTPPTGRWWASAGTSARPSAAGWPPGPAGPGACPPRPNGKRPPGERTGARIPGKARSTRGA